MLRIEGCKCRAKEIAKHTNALLGKHLQGSHGGANLQCRPAGQNCAPMVHVLNIYPFWWTKRTHWAGGGLNSEELGKGRKHLFCNEIKELCAIQRGIAEHCPK